MTVVGHGGNSIGYSSYLLMINGIGMTKRDQSRNTSLFITLRCQPLGFRPKKRRVKRLYFNLAIKQASTSFCDRIPLRYQKFAYTNFVKKLRTTSFDSELCGCQQSSWNGKVTAACRQCQGKDLMWIRDWTILILAVIELFGFVVFLVRVT